MTGPMSHRTDFAAASAALRAARSILIVTHIEPDGDAIGSMLGLGNALRAEGRAVCCAVDGGVPSRLGFLPGADEVRATPPTERADLFISVDANTAERTGRCGAAARARCATTINLDHHISNTGFGDIQLVQPAAVSASEVVLHWLEWMALPLSERVALPLLTGLVTDTLGFRTGNVTAQTLQLALRLMQAGASLPDIMARTLERRPFHMLCLWQQALQSLTLQDGVIAAAITREGRARAGAAAGSDDGLANLLRTVDEARIAAVFKEADGGRIAVSLRSKPGYDVAQVALTLGGGGHRQAAGATVAGPLAAAQALVLPLLQQAVRAGETAASA